MTGEVTSCIVNAPLSAEQNCLEVQRLDAVPRLVKLLSSADRATRAYAVQCLSVLAGTGKCRVAVPHHPVLEGSVPHHPVLEAGLSSLACSLSVPTPVQGGLCTCSAGPHAA